MSGADSVRQGDRRWQEALERQAAAGNGLAERLTLDVLHGEKRRPSASSIAVRVTMPGC